MEFLSKHIHKKDFFLVKIPSSLMVRVLPWGRDIGIEGPAIPELKQGLELSHPKYMLKLLAS